jgi:2-amino-4-hydroxy-6-hydroxymethyldihydropteridine diphosphokinase
MNRTYLSLGSNLEDRIQNLSKARSLLNKRAGEIVSVSGVYETEPWGFTSDMNFYNQVIELHTQLEPVQLLDNIQQIEKDCGRVADKVRFAPRTLDADILFFNDLICNLPGLVIPHPSLHLRRFVLVPMAEIAPGLVHPILKKKISRLLQDCPDRCRIIQKLP